MSSTNAIGSSPNAPSSRRRRIGERVLTALRVLLAIQFAAGGLLKLVGAEPMVTLFADIGAGQWLRHVVGVLELAGAIGLLVPAVAGAAAAGLTALVTGALLTRVAVLGGPPVAEIVFLVAVAVVGYHRRAQLRSLAARLPR
jgi:putative oxidoreductase